MMLSDKDLEMNLSIEKMSRDELELAYIEAKENEYIYRKFRKIAKKMVNSKGKKKYFIPRKWIESLDMPGLGFEYTLEQRDTVNLLKMELEDLAYELGFINEVAEGFRDKRNQIGKREAKAIIERLGIHIDKEGEE